MAKRVLVVILVTILVLLGAAVGGEYMHYTHPFLTPTVRLGYIRGYQIAPRAAFDALVRAVEQHPKTPRVVVEWKAGTFADYLRSIPRAAYDDTFSRALLYDRSRGRFAMYEPVNGATQFDWYDVRPEILVTVRDRRGDFTQLSSYGCRSVLP